MSAKASLIDFLASSRIDSRDGAVWDDGAIVHFFAVGTSNDKAVWLDRDKTLPTVAGIYQTTLGTDGSVLVFGDGVYDIKIYDAADKYLTTPLKVFQGVNASDSTVGAELTSPLFLDTTYPTKKVAMDVSGVSTGTTRAVVWPDKAGTVAVIVGGALTTNIIGNVTGSATTATTATTATNAGNADTVTGINTSVSPGGSFTGGTVYLAKVGRVVTMTFSGLTHSSLSQVTSGICIPSAYRPLIFATNIFSADTFFVYHLLVLTDGTFRTSFFDWAGSLTASTSSSYGTITYISAT